MATHFCGSVAKSCPTLSDPMDCSTPASQSFTISLSLLKLMSTESVRPSNHLILCRPLLLLPSIFPSLRVFSTESALCIRWPKYWSFSVSSHHQFPSCCCKKCPRGNSRASSPTRVTQSPSQRPKESRAPRLLIPGEHARRNTPRLMSQKFSSLTIHPQDPWQALADRSVEDAVVPGWGDGSMRGGCRGKFPRRESSTPGDFFKLFQPRACTDLWTQEVLWNLQKDAPGLGDPAPVCRGPDTRVHKAFVTLFEI